MAMTRTSKKLQMLNFEASHQSIFHTPLPVSMGLGWIKDNSKNLDEEPDEDSDSESVANPTIQN